MRRCREGRCLWSGATRVIPALYQPDARRFSSRRRGKPKWRASLRPKPRSLRLMDCLAAARRLRRLGITPVLSTLDEVSEWSALAKARGQTRRRAAYRHWPQSLGLAVSRDAGLAQNRSWPTALDVRLMMSHLASADNPVDPKNRDQLLAFETLSALFPRVPRSLAASDGLMLGPDYHFDLVRPGYALYGGQASQTNPAPVIDTVTVAARIFRSPMSRPARRLDIRQLGARAGQAGSRRLPLATLMAYRARQVARMAVQAATC